MEPTTYEVVFMFTFFLAYIATILIPIKYKIMKLFKKISIVVLAFAFTLNSCSDDCSNQNPSAIVVNNGTSEVSVQIQTTGGNTENINNVLPGMASDYVNYSPGEVEYTIVLKDKTELVETVTMEFCKTYEISIDLNNTITTTSSAVD